MNVVKLLSLLVNPHVNMASVGLSGDSKSNHGPVQLYKNSFGIVADPIAQFTIVFGSLIQDVDHPA